MDKDNGAGNATKARNVLPPPFLPQLPASFFIVIPAKAGSQT